MRRRYVLLLVLLAGLLILSACSVPPASGDTSLVIPRVQSGVAHTCLLTQGGTVLCWGQNASPDQPVDPRTFARPVPVKGLQAIAIAVGWYHTCAATVQGSVLCWGRNASGQLGNNSVEDAAAPVEVAGLQDITSLAAGSEHTCALTNAGEVYCWGKNDGGQLGDGTTTERHVPVPARKLSGKPAEIIAGPSYTCALLADGRVECWGDIGFMPAASDADRVHTSPVQIGTPEGNVLELAAGDFDLCALTKSGEVLCEGAMTSPNDPLFSQPPESTRGLTGRVLHIFAGGDFFCALTVENSVECWGHNYFGQLGGQMGIDSAVPVKIDLKDQNAIALGGGHYTGCALLSEGGVTCWGDTSFGQLGDGTARWK